MSDAERFVLEFDEETEEFNQTGSPTLDTDKRTYLIIDEAEKRMTISYRVGISIVTKRKIERRVNSYSKSGFSLGDKRVGLGFPLEAVNADEKLPDILLTHGHTFGTRLERDEIPPYAEPEPNMDIVPGIAAIKTDGSTDTSRHIVTAESNQVPTAAPVSTSEPTPTPVSTSEPTPASAPVSTSEPTPASAPVSTSEPETTSESKGLVAETLEIKGETSSIQSSDDTVWALGQFVEQYARQGKVCVVSLEDSGKFHLVTLNDSLKLDKNSIDGNFIIDEVNLYDHP